MTDFGDALRAAIELIGKEASRAELVEAIRPLATRRQALRQFYKAALPDILAAGSAEWGIDLYEVDWLPVFSPIEAALWHDIRAEGLVMYPQFPVLGYFVDFGNPVAKVAIECDGAKWHQDAEADRARQAAIEAQGWTVHRISGRACKTDSDPETGAPGEARRFIQDIATRYPVSRKGDQ